jgi:catechol 2,3-dioxygenase-like lactoylglutathione lyase family enzyme
MTGIARFSLVALDCPDAGALAAFYGRITGWPVRDDETEGDWIELEHPQQIHLDFDVLDLDEGEAAVLALGARKAEHQPGTTFRVFLDPAGHPFCLVLDHSMRTS